MKKFYQKTISLVSVVLLTLSVSYAQITIVDNSNEEFSPPVCRLPVTDYISNTYIPARAIVKARLEGRTNPCSTINVNYVGFPNDPIDPSMPGEAQVAFQVAVDIWETLLESSVPINITANWVNQGANTLGSASAAFYATVPGRDANTLYPAALAEKLIGSELNGTNSVDINCNFNRQFSGWFFGDGVNDENEIANTQTDFIAVVLHELGHGLGVAGFGIGINPAVPGDSDSATEGNIRRGASGLTLPPNAQFYSIWDSYIEGPDLFGGGVSILDENTFPDPSAQMLVAFTSNNLTCNSPTATAQNGGDAPKTYSPASFNAGSTYSHWDESTFNNTVHALMTPRLGQNEVIRDPGNVTLGFMEDMGWSLCQGSLSTPEFTANDIAISPNPFNGKITVNIPSELSNQSFTISIVDLNGRVVINQQADVLSGEISITNLDNLTPNVYFMTLTSEDSNLSITKKLIKN